MSKNFLYTNDKCLSLKEFHKNFAKSKKVYNKTLEINYREYSSTTVLEEHYHLSYEILYIVEGEAEFIINNKKYIAKKNSLIFISPLEKHTSLITKTPYKRYYIWFDNDYFYTLTKYPVLFSILKYHKNDFTHVLDFSNKENMPIENILSSMLNEFNFKQPLWNVKIDFFIIDMLIHVYRNYPQHFLNSNNTNTAKTILEIQQYIEHNYFLDVNLENISKEFFISKYYLSKMFKEITGFNFKEYVIIYRLQKAKELLETTDKTISSISLDIGFNNVNQFIKLFRIKENCTPLQYRKNSKNPIL